MEDATGSVADEGVDDDDISEAVGDNEEVAEAPGGAATTDIKRPPQGRF